MLSGFILVSPQLKYNIINKMSGSIRLRSSPFGSRKPAIPTAKTLTIARIASPFSMDRAYQSSFLRALESYLKSTVRLVKQGDLIALKLDSDDARVQPDEQKREGAEQEDEILFNSLFVLPPVRSVSTLIIRSS